jgi:branched-chain amino acid transport system ATP-binding protein
MRLLEVDDLVAGYGGADVIRGVSLHVDEGEVTAVLGPNGAGKTTLLRAISGDVRPTSGTVRLDDEDITGRPAHEVAALGIGHVLEGRHIFTSLSVEENLLLGGRGRPRAEVEEALEQMYGFFPILRERRSLSGASLSGGQQQMLAVSHRAVAIEGADSVLRLDGGRLVG